MLVVRTLLLGPAHGHQIVQHTERTTDGLLQVERGSLYPALHRLERQGRIVAKWEPGGQRPEAGIQVLPPHRDWKETTCVRRVEVEKND